MDNTNSNYSTEDVSYSFMPNQLHIVLHKTKLNTNLKFTFKVLKSRPALISNSGGYSFNKL